MIRQRGFPSTILLAAILGACSASEEPPRAPARTILRDGAGLESLLPAEGADTSVVLVYDPAQCFSCDGELAHWLKLRSQRRWGLRLVLTREPTPSEATQLQLFRLAPADYLHPSAERLATPRVYRFSGLTLVDSAVGRPGQAALLARTAATAGPRFSSEGGPPRVQVQ